MKIGMEKSKFESRADTMKLIEALEGLEMKEGADFPQGDKTLRKEDHQAFLHEFIFEVKRRDLPPQRDGAEGQDHRSAGLQVPRGVNARGTSIDIRSPAESRGATSAPILKTEQLSVRFGGLAALSNVNFAVERGNTHAIIGPNGAGKSTFFNCLTGVLRPTSGRIIFNGEDITGLSSEQDLAEGHRALLPDHQHPAQRHGAGERAHRRAVAPARLEHGLRITAPLPTSTKRRKRRLQSVGLLDKAHELASNLSHGEQRNLEIGIALATEPRCSASTSRPPA